MSVHHSSAEYIGLRRPIWGGVLALLALELLCSSVDTPSSVDTASSVDTSYCVVTSYGLQ
ncbi:uncharacterized protein SCHCODRAFT_02640309 [Schizophyllum commune H4-8]|uniref:uncharacterized protein n=1 Tax=Schizophyllum commune (strain H4-8 / FGSC 9210) TaxID=578458 RepID=UPI00215F54D1|nr:uncharacterized protein SCHCODRAFT_02640309 [Schizophyllum commune H4-8]KAI5886923.1 hypothetical protein SCHCODRAFT_02640309 [Schizophyllum commune H4-8]